MNEAGASAVDAPLVEAVAQVEVFNPNHALTPGPGRNTRRAARSAPKTRKAAAAHPLTAYVLHRYDWSESSVIVELFTRAQGRVAVVAKGAKRPTSNFRAVLLPFLPLQVLLGRPPQDENTEVVNLRSAEWAGGVPIPPAKALLSGYYLNELLLKLLARQDPHADLFDAYADTLVALAQAAGSGDAVAAEGLVEGVTDTVKDSMAESAVLRAFELLLLRELGVLPELNAVTLTAQPLQPESRYTLHPDNGLVADLAGNAQTPSGAAWLAVDAALARGTLALLRQVCVPLATPLRAPLRTLLHYHLGQRPLRTRQVWQGVQRLAENTR